MRIVTLLFYMVLSISASAQYELSGKIVDTNESPLEFVNVLISTIDNAELISGEITDSNGKFTFSNLSKGTYNLEVSFIGYATLMQEVEISFSTELSPIILNEDTNVLDEVSITAKKPVFERKSDRTIVNVQNAITSAGGNALQILERSPGVQVDRANNVISLMGKNGVVVSINGKVMRLEEEALLRLLASTPSSNIKSIELITNPPASYDAQGDGGVINIVMVKNENDGFNGNANLFFGMSRRAKYGGGLKFNLNKGKMNLYGDLSSNNDYSDQGVTLRQRIAYPNRFVDALQMNDRPNYDATHNAKIGIDYQLSDRIEYGAFVSFIKTYWELDATATTEYFTPFDDLGQEVLSSHEINEMDHYMVSNHLGIKINEHAMWSIDYDYLNYDVSNPTSYSLDQFGVNNNLIENRTFTSGKLTPFDFHVFKTDFRNQVFGDLTFETGAKITLSDVINNTNLTYLTPEESIDPFFTDLIDMKEEIYAAYASLKGNIGEANSFTAGIRYEDYQVDLNSDISGDLINRNRGRFYPTISFQHKLEDAKSISFYYNERVNRPGFQVLAPAFYFFDTRTVLGGNIDAIPTITRTLGGDLNFKTVFLSFSYTDMDAPISWGQPGLQTENNILILRPENAPDRDIIAMALSFPLQITDFWSTQWNFNFFHRKETALLEGLKINNSGFGFTGNVTQTFKLPHKWEFEASSRWNSEVKVGLGAFRPRFSTTLGIQKTFANNSKLALSWNDIFNWGSFFGLRTDREDQGIYYDWNYELEGDVVRLSYSMPFGNTGLKIREKHTSGSADEQRRATN